RDGEHGVVGGGPVQVEVVAGDVGRVEGGVLQEGRVHPVEGAVVGREPPAGVDLQEGVGAAAGVGEGGAGGALGGVDLQDAVDGDPEGRGAEEGGLGDDLGAAEDVQRPSHPHAAAVD